MGGGNVFSPRQQIINVLRNQGSQGNLIGVAENYPFVIDIRRIGGEVLRLHAGMKSQSDTDRPPPSR